MYNARDNIKLCAYAGMRELIQENGLKCALNFSNHCGYESVELLYLESECEGALKNAAFINKTKDACDAKIGCISVYVDVASYTPPYEVRSSAIDAVKACIDLAVKVGCPLVHHTLVTRLTGGRSDYDKVLPVALEAASDIASYALERGITILYEPQGMLFNGLDGYLTFFSAMRSKYENIGVCLDVGNTLWVDEDCYALAEKCAKHVRHVHVKDYVLDSEDGQYRTLGGRTIKEVALGDGVIDLNKVMNILDSVKYRGYISVEDNSGNSFEYTAENAARILGKR